MARLRAKALKRMDQILDLPLPGPSDPDYARMASIQKDAAGTVISASLKADENCFRQRQTDALSRLYEAVEAESNRRSGVVIESSSQPLLSVSPTP